MSFVPPPNKQLFYEQVWALVRQIPRGRVATYGQIAKMLCQPEGVTEEDYQLSAARWVGLAMSACPEDVPWQRVINSQGKISYRAEAGKQKQLLQSEGSVLELVVGVNSHIVIYTAAHNADFYSKIIRLISNHRPNIQSSTPLDRETSICIIRDILYRYRKLCDPIEPIIMCYCCGSLAGR